MLNLVAQSMHLYVQSADLYYRWRHDKTVDAATARAQFETLATQLDTLAALPAADPKDPALAIKPSTADFADPGNPAKFCFWIRINNELMKVTAFDPATNTATVERAFDSAAPLWSAVAERSAVARSGDTALSDSRITQTPPAPQSGVAGLRPLPPHSKEPAATTAAPSIQNPKSKIENSAPPAPHRAGATVLAPVYLGDRTQLDAARKSNSWPGGPDALRYAMDPRQPATQKFQGLVIAGIMRSGFDGAWLDTFQLRLFNCCDALGRRVTRLWDFKTNQLYTNETYLEAFKEFLRGLRAVVRADTQREPILFANSASGAYSIGIGTKELFNHGDIRDLIDGFCFEDSYVRPSARRDPANPGPVRATFKPITGRQWLPRVEDHADAARSGLRAICMIGPAGYLARQINPSQPNFDQLLRYAYASFLLTVTKERTTMFGFPMHVSERNNKNKNNTTPPLGIVPWPRVLYAGMGDPAQENQINALKLPDSPVYQRTFQNGLVLVNPSDEGAPPVTIPIPPGCIDAMTGNPVSSPLILPPADAAILIRKN